MSDYCAFHGVEAGEWSSPTVRLSETHYAHRHRTERHAHLDATLAFVVAGAFVERQGAKVIECGPASLLFRPAGVEHDDAFGERASACFNVEMRPSFHDEAPAARVDAGCGRAAWAAARLLVEFRDSLRDDLALECLVAEVVDAIHPGRAVAPPARIRRVVEKLEDAYTGSWSLEELARDAGVHPMHLARSFRRAFGESIGERVRRLRVEHAFRELVRGSSPIAEIAQGAGFADQAHLTRIFRRHTGVTPARLRSLLGVTTLRTFKT